MILCVSQLNVSVSHDREHIFLADHQQFAAIDFHGLTAVLAEDDPVANLYGRCDEVALSLIHI